MSSNTDTLQTSTLRNGTRVRLRDQAEGDRALLAGLFDGLSDRSRYLRFMSGVPTPLPRRMLDFLDGADGRSHVGVIAIHRGRAVGAARYIRAADGAPEAEVAFTVADEFQRQGLGRLMLTRLVDHAAASGIDRLRFEMLSENRAARGLVASFGGSLRSDGPSTFAVLPTHPEAVPQRAAA